MHINMTCRFQDGSEEERQALGEPSACGASALRKPDDARTSSRIELSVGGVLASLALTPH